MSAYQPEFHAVMMARVPGVSSNRFCAWLRRRRPARSLSDDDLLRQVREAGLAGISRRKVRAQTRGAPGPGRGQAPVQGRCSGPSVARGHHLRPARAGFLCLAIMLDAFSRRIVGSSMASHLRTDQALGAPDLALAQRRPRRLVHHSGRGSQYTCMAFSTRCREAGVLPSTGKAGDCFDNAMTESFFASLEWELIDRTPFRDRGHSRRELFRCIEGSYNPHRRHSGIGHGLPVNFEKTCGEAA